MIFRKLPVLLFICLTLSSCLELKFLGKLDEKGAGEMTITTEVPAKNSLNMDDPLPSAEQLQAETLTLMKEEQEKALASGVEIQRCKVELEGDKKVHSTTVKFDSLKELNAYLNYGGQSKTEVSLASKGKNTTFSHKVTVPKPEEQTPQQQAAYNAVMEKARVTISWKFPGEVGVISEGGVVSDDGHTVNWEIPLRKLVEEGVDVFAIYEGVLAEPEAATGGVKVLEVSEPEEVDSLFTLFNVMLFLSIMGAVLIAFLVFLKIRLARLEKG